MSSINSNDDALNAPSYYVPALEKGLDILECLAAQGVPLTQAQIARAIGRGANELFRMLTTLERRGYIQRDPLTGAYGLTLRLFELSHTHSPLQGLLRAAARCVGFGGTWASRALACPGSDEIEWSRASCVCIGRCCWFHGLLLVF